MMRPAGTPPRPGRPGSRIGLLLAGSSASVIGIGFARFAFTPLLPLLIQAGWFPQQAALLLTAANLIGYLAGALAARALAARIGDTTALKAMLLLAAASFLACAAPLSFAWFFAWRLLSGLAGGVVMVLVSGTLLPHLGDDRRGAMNGAIFAGLGIGILASGTLVPLLSGLGLRVVWIALGAICLALALGTWRCWPPARRTPVPPRGAARIPGALRIAILGYGLTAVGIVPAMTLGVDYLSRALGWGAGTGAALWILFGVGALAGPMLYGALADRLGARLVLRTALLVAAVALAVLAIAPGRVPTAIAMLVLGTFPPGIVPLMLHRVHELAAGTRADQARTWAVATVAFSLFQALAGYAGPLAIDLGIGYPVLFAASCAAMLAAGALDVLAERRRRV